MLYQLSYSRPRLLYQQPRPGDGDGGEGRIRTSEGLRPADLQSAAFDRFATSPPHSPTISAKASKGRGSSSRYLELAKGFEPPTR